MAKQKVTGLMSTEIGLDTAKATESLNQLKSAVKDSTNEWKQMESQMKQSGDEIGASEAKYKGLTQSVEKQQDVLAKLKQEQSEVNRSTESGEQTYQKYASQITQAERQLASMTSQQQKAKQAYELQESGIAGLNKEIRQNIQETEAQVNRLKAEGKETEAIDVQKKGLARTLEKQGQLYEAQRKQLDKMTQSGEASSESISKQKIALDKTGTSIAKGKQSLEELNEQQRKAKTAYGLQSDGITELNRKIKENDELTKLQTDRLDAEGRKTESVAKAKEGLRTKISLMNQLYEKQAKHLKQLESAEGDNTDAISKQRLALERTRTAIAQADSNMKGLSKTSEKASSTFSEVFKGTALAQGAMQAFNSVRTSIEGAIEAGAEYNKEQDTMKTVWHALTTEAPQDGKELIGFINDMANSSIYSADSINEMAQSFYHVGSNAKQTKQWTQDFINLGSTMHLSNAEIAESGKTFAKIVAGGKVGAEDLNMMIDRFPMFGEAVQKASGKSMQELRQMSSQGKLTSDVFVKAMDELGVKYKDGQAEAMTSFQGMTMYLGKRRAQLFGEIEQSSFNMSKKMKSDLLDITSDKSMEKYAQAISQAMGKVMAVVEKMVEYIRAHKKDIMEMFSNIANITGILGGAIWNTIKGTIIGVAKAIGAIGGNAKKSHDPLKTINGALEAILRHKGAIKALGAVIATTFMAKKMIDFGKGVRSVISDVKAMRSALIRLATSEKVVTGAQKALTFAQKAFNLALKANPIGLVITAITALVVAFVELYKHNKKFRAFINGLVQSAGKFFKPLGKWIASATKIVGRFFKNIGKWFGGVGKSIGNGANVIGKWFSGLVKGFQKGWNSFTKFAMKLLKTFAKIVLISMALPIGIGVTLMKPLVGPMKKIIGDLAKWLKKVWAPVSKAWTNTWNSIGKWFSGMLNGISKAWNNTMSAIRNTLSKSMDAISGAWSRSWNSIANFFTDVWNKMVRAFKPIIELIHRIVSDTVGAISGTWSKAWNGIADFFGGIWNKLVRTGDSGVNSVKNVFTPVLDAISRVFSNTWKGITDGFSNMWNDMMGWAKSDINGVIGIINNGIGAINSVIGMFGGSRGLSRIPKFANGTKGAPKGLAIVNDAPGENYQEAIIDNSGKATVLEGRNRLVEFSGGETVIPAHALPHFASGTSDWLSSAVGWVADKWTQLTSFLREPIVALTNVMHRAVGTITGSPLVSTVAPMMTQGLIHGIASPIVNMLSGIKGKHDSDEHKSLLKRLFGKGFAQGGVVSQHGFYEVAEQNMPEIIIPLDPAKRPRANDLLAQANERINGNNKVAGNSSVVNEGDSYNITIQVNADLTPGTLQKLQQVVEDTVTRKQNARRRAFG